VFPTTVVLSPQGIATWVIVGQVDWTSQAVQGWMGTER
jgi:hypothetical protein